MRTWLEVMLFEWRKHLPQFWASMQHPLTNPAMPVLDDKSSQRLAILKCIIIQLLHGRGNLNRFKRIAVKGMVTDVFAPRRDCYRMQRATMKRLRLDSLYGVWKNDRSEAITARECPLTNFLHATCHNNFLKPVEAAESAFRDCQYRMPINARRDTKFLYYVIPFIFSPIDKSGNDRLAISEHILPFAASGRIALLRDKPGKSPERIDISNIPFRNQIFIHRIKAFIKIIKLNIIVARISRSRISQPTGHARLPRKDSYPIAGGELREIAMLGQFWTLGEYQRPCSIIEFRQFREIIILGKRKHIACRVSRRSRFCNISDSHAFLFLGHTILHFLSTCYWLLPRKILQHIISTTSQALEFRSSPMFGMPLGAD